MSDAVPAAPLVPVEVDLRGLPFMPLDVVRLLDSDLFALTSGDEFKAALSLWCKAWLQVPAASLPNDDRVLAHLSGAGARWRKVKGMALRGWQLCSDDRLYHPVIAEKALAAWEERVAYRERRGNETERLRRHREEHKRLRDQLRELGFTYPHNTPMETLRAALQDAELNIHRGVSSNAPVRVSGPSPETQPLRLREGQGQGQGEGYLKDQEQAPQQRRPSPEAGDDQPTEKPKRASRLPEDWALPDDWLDWALTERPEFSEADMRKVGEGFRDYWCSAAGKGATKVDWLATWRNWVRKESAPSATPRKPAVGSKRYPFIPPRGYQLEDHEFWHPQMTDTVLSTRTHDFSTLERLPDGEGAC